MLSIAVAIAWWNEHTNEERLTMLNSLSARNLPVTVEEAWNQFGRGSYRQGWRPRADLLAEAERIVEAERLHRENEPC